MSSMRLSEDAPDKPISEVDHDDAATPTEIQEDIDEVVVAEQMLYDIRVLGQMLLNEELTVKEYLQRFEQLEGVWPERNKFLD